MIVVDTSALVAVLVEEPKGHQCWTALRVGAPTAISAGTTLEALIVAQGLELEAEMRRLLIALDIEVVAVTAELAFAAAAAYAIWGKGRHPARLNYGDCFSYALAKSLDCPLLFVGNDFSQTDIVSAFA